MPKTVHGWDVCFLGTSVSKGDLRNNSTETKTVGKGGVFRLDGNHMKEASEEELGLNLTMWRVGAGRRASVEARWILDPRTAPGAGCGAMGWEALRVSFLRVPGTRAFPTPCSS